MLPSHQVYCGLTSQGQLIAVKQVSLDTSDPDTAKREYSRLQGEVELLKTLRHTNIVGFLGTSLYQHIVSIFMEYIPGGSIASILHRFGPLPERVLALYTHQILEGVAYLHLNRVIHRDLKGNNVMLMPTGIIKLIDFGCARRLSCLNHTASNNGDLLKSVHGTPYWMAPEEDFLNCLSSTCLSVINETGYGRKSDIWSVGCTVFEMATGKPPLAHMDKMAALFYIGAQRGLITGEEQRGEKGEEKDEVPAAPVPPLEILLTLEQEVEDEEGGWWLWLTSGYALLRDVDEEKEVDPGGASVIPSMLTSPGGPRSRPPPPPGPSGPPRPLPLCV
uniref:Mitogen-activated protein kinase kinase kinase 19 n=1 Tax=Seriola lalandi dorsalis TaxID=1841481 RepID=A0A3B4YDY9_SERLL